MIKQLSSELKMAPSMPFFSLFKNCLLLLLFYKNSLGKYENQSKFVRTFKKKLPFSIPFLNIFISNRASHILRIAIVWPLTDKIF